MNYFKTIFTTFFIFTLFFVAAACGTAPAEPDAGEAAGGEAVPGQVKAVQFDSEPKLVSSITLVTTLISILTITLLLALLQ